MQKTIFQKIIDHELPTERIYEDEQLIAFRDITPRAPVHILIIPKKILPTLNAAEEDDILCLGSMVYTAAKLAKAEGIDQSGYRVVINCNQHGGQEIFHLHLHLIGGKQLGKMS